MNQRLRAAEGTRARQQHADVRPRAGGVLGSGPGRFDPLVLQRTIGNRATSELLAWGASGNSLSRQPGAVALSLAKPSLRSREHPGGTDPHEIRQTALAGLKSTGRALPYRERIQTSFGPEHDLRGLVAHDDGGATQAAAAIGADAYTIGDHVAFAAQPTLRLAAHEAAHAIQQRQGVHLPNGLGKAGDRYERRADEVADRVINGDSAAAWLRAGAGSIAASGSRPARTTVQRQQSKPSGSRDVINVEETISDLEKSQLNVAGWSAGRPWYAQVGAWFPFFGLQLVKDSVWLGNTLFGVTELQDAADVIADPTRTPWQRVRAGAWAATIIALDFMMVGGVAKSVGVKLASLGSRLSETAVAQILRASGAELVDAAANLAREQMPRVIAWTETTARPALSSAKSAVAGWLRSAGQSITWRKLTTTKILPEVEAILDRDITPYFRRKIDGLSAEYAGRQGGIGTMLGHDVDRAKQAAGLERAPISTKAQKEAAGELGTALAMELKGWRIVEIPRLPGNQGVDILMTKDGWFLSAEEFTGVEAKGTAGSKVTSLLKRYTFNGHAYVQGDELFNTLRLRDPRLITRAAPADQAGLQALVNDITTNISGLQAHFGRVQTAAREVRLFRIDGATIPSLPEIERMTFGKIKRAYYLMILGETAPQALRGLGGKKENR